MRQVSGVWFVYFLALLRSHFSQYQLSLIESDRRSISLSCFLLLWLKSADFVFWGPPGFVKVFSASSTIYSAKVRDRYPEVRPLSARRGICHFNSRFPRVPGSFHFDDLADAPLEFHISGHTSPPRLDFQYSSRSTSKLALHLSRAYTSIHIVVLTLSRAVTSLTE